MQDVETDEEYTFHCDRWLSRDKEDFDVVREFPISRKTGSTPQGIYKGLFLENIWKCQHYGIFVKFGCWSISYALCPF